MFPVPVYLYANISCPKNTKHAGEQLFSVFVLVYLVGLFSGACK